MKIEWVKKVYSDGGHNGFPGLACYRGKYFLAFRSGNGHVSDKAEQIIMSSDNGKDWNILQRQYFRGPDGKTADYRDSHFLVYENRLLLLSFCTPVSDGKRGETYSQVQILDDSMKKFSEPNIILKGHVLWKPYISGNHLYGATYCSERQVDLFHSSDGLKWEKISTIADNGSETSIYSTGKDKLTAFVRKEIPPYYMEIFRSEKPFTEWTKISEIPQIIQCPHVINFHGKLLLFGRYRPDYLKTADPEKPSFLSHRTMIWEVTEDFSLRELAALPSSGDNAYPETTPLPDGSLLMAYYSQHETDKSGKWQEKMSADIFIASLKPCF